MSWKYSQPVEIIFGDNKIQELVNILRERSYKKAIIITTNHFVKNGLVKDLIKDSQGTIIDYFNEVEKNPTVENVNQCSRKIKEVEADCVVALGGGSIMDCAKAAATLALTDDKIEKYHGTKEQIPKKHIPLIAIPTTSGTGSEVTCVSVLTNKETGKKLPIASEGFYPNLAIIDPALTYSMPPYITAVTGIDALCHSLEAFWSKNHQPICDALALYSCELIFKYLYKAFSNPSDKIARQKMSEASLIAGLAFSIPKTTSSHACSYPLTNIYNIPHGEACGLTIDYFARINKDVEDGRLDDFARKLGFKDTDHMADEIYELKIKMGLRVDLKDFDLDDNKIQELVKLSKHPNLDNNPVHITENTLQKMYEGFR